MKIIRKLLPALLSVVMLMTLTVPAYAADTTTLTIKGTTAGQTYHLYRVMDLSQSGDHFAYSVSDKFSGYFTGDEWGDPATKITEMSASELAALSGELVSWALSNGVVMDYSVTASGTTATIAAVEYGYYLMNPVGAFGSSGDNAVMFSLDSVSGASADITVKAEYPTITMTVNGAEGSAAACMNDTLTYVVKTKVPDMTGYTSYTFVLTNTLDSTLNFASVSSVMINDENVSYEVKTSASGDKSVVTITMKDFKNYASYVGSDVVITYTATLDTAAEINAANTVTAQLKYSNDPSNTSSTGVTAAVQADVYTTALYIKKTDGEGNVLTGASFKMEGNYTASYGVTYTYTQRDDEYGEYWLLKDGTYTTIKPETIVNGVMVPSDNYSNVICSYDRTETIAKVSAGTSCEVDSNGELSFMGIGAGTYTITETVTPAGYNAIAPITVQITFSDGTFAVTADGGTVSNNTLTIVNQSGVQLPSTGGSGTTVLYLLGGLMVLAGLALRMAKKRA